MLVPPFFLITVASLCEITPMRRKKKALRDPPGPTLDTLRSFCKIAPISSLEKKLQVLPKKGFSVLQKEFTVLSLERISSPFFVREGSIREILLIAVFSRPLGKHEKRLEWYDPSVTPE